MGMRFRYLGLSQEGMYERVTINRKERTTAIDRMDANWWQPNAFIGRRDLFYQEARGDEGSPEQVTFVRHNFWLPVTNKFFVQLWSSWDAMGYKRAFKGAM